MAGLALDEVRAWVEASCAAQGLPVAVTESETLRKVATLLGGTAAAAPGRRGRPALQAPHRDETVRIEPGFSGQRVAMDDHVVEDRCDDCTLPIEVEARPLSA